MIIFLAEGASTLWTAGRDSSYDVKGSNQLVLRLRRKGVG